MTKFSILLLMVFLSCSVVTSKKLILGTWSKSADENAEFTIGKDSIQYFGVDYLYRYELKNGCLSVLDSNKLVLKFKIYKLLKDSLILGSENEGNRGIVYRYYKIDEKR